MKQQVFNPYLPSYEYIPDGEPHVFGDRVYIYGSHDKFDGNNFCMNDYVCWSAPVSDLSDWRYEGVIWKKTDDPNYKKGTYMYAPDVCRGPDGKYYIYYAFSPGVTRKSWAIRVAVSDFPSGPFRYLGEVDLYPWSKEFLPFDPAVYVESGRVWLYYGSAMFFPVLGVSKSKIKGGAVVELDSKDMHTVISEPRLTVRADGKDNEYGKHAFFEASGMRKINGKYYFVYSSLLGHELCYAIGDSPVGPWKYGGTIVSNGDIGLNDCENPKTASNYTGNTHGNIVEISGKYYVFYHRHTNRHCFSRQACAEQIEIDENGLIQQVEVTSCGLNGGPLKGKGKYEARIACNLTSAKGGRFHGSIFKKTKGGHPYFTQSGKDRNDSPDQYISNFCDGATAGFKYFEFDGTNKISVELCGNATGMLTVTDGVNAVASIKIKPCKTRTEYSSDLNIENGVKPLYFTYRGKGKFDFISFCLN